MDKDLQKAIKVKRDTISLMGHSTDHLTDEELKQGIINFTETVNHIGFKAEEVAESITKAIKLIKLGGNINDISL